jgi:addiction module RelB/DinJ family antitoxin
MKTHIVRARIEGNLKADAMRVLGSHGLDLSDAIRLFLRRVVALGGIPFPIRNQTGPQTSSTTKPQQERTTVRAGDRAQLASVRFSAGELFLIRPEDARAAKIEWPVCKLSD